MVTNELKEKRKQMFDKMEHDLRDGQPVDDSIFYNHSSEDRIVLSHALFWVMTRSLVGPITKEKYYLLLRRYQEEMLEAYLTEDDYSPELLRYCNILYDSLPMILKSTQGPFMSKDARRLAAISVVAAGYGGDMAEDLAWELLDDMDFVFNKVKCRKIEQMLPRLNKLVEAEMKGME